MALSAVDTGPTDPDAWRKSAACIGLKVDIFFPSPSDKSGVEFAKSFCAKCRVRKDCIEFAHDNEGTGDPNLDLGIYGGLTYDERRSYWRSRRPSNMRKAQSG